MPDNSENVLQDMSEVSEANEVSDAGQGGGRFGYLRIFVAAARRALPVYNALVSVYSSSGEEEQDLLALLQTDESGGTELISLPAPALANSLTPGDRPVAYSTYYLRIAAANFVTRDRLPVQIFPGVESELVINMQAGLQ